MDDHRFGILRRWPIVQGGERMSQNIDTLRATLEAFNRRDFDGALKCAHPDIELRPALHELDVRRMYRGRGELREFMETITDAWEEYVVEAENPLVAPDGRVLAVERWHARGRDGIEFHFELTDVYEFRDDLIVRIVGFRDKADALEAAGLAPEP
jgi:ketosteroid isomerase-like protein